jgi:transposase
MQGRKELVPKMLYSVSLQELVPKDNFYRKLSQTLDLHFLRTDTAAYYGKEGQESIDPIVFFKILIVGYLNNIGSDRRLIEYCADSLGIRLFLGYDIDEVLPWHSTISRTRQLYGEDVFLSLFQKVLSQCVAKGMVRGKRQAIDSAFVKANASMNSLLEKEVVTDAVEYAKELNEQSDYQIRPNSIAQPEDNTQKQTDDHGNPVSVKHLSNQTHYSATDPDASISTKPGKPRQLNYFGQIAVDDAHHVITGAMADFASKRDSDCLPGILSQTIANLASNDMQVDQVIADTNYSSGSALRYCEEQNIDAYIPNFGPYKSEREGLLYNEAQDQYECQRGHKAILTFKGFSGDKTKRIYRSSRTACKDCPLFESCLSKSCKYKETSHSIHKNCYDRMQAKLNKGHTARRMRRIRSRTVEPVLGTLINYRNMKRVNARGITQANKHVLMAALSYNLKKLLNFTCRQVKAIAKALSIPQGEGFLSEQQAPMYVLLA